MSKEKFREINRMHCGSPINTHYAWIASIIKNRYEVQLINYILNFQHENKNFYAQDNTIAIMIGCSGTSVSNIVKRLKNQGLIQTKTSSNKKKDKGGKTRYIKVNERKLVQLYKTWTEKNKITEDLHSQKIIEFDEFENETTPVPSAVVEENRDEQSKSPIPDVFENEEFRFEDFNVKDFISYALRDCNDVNEDMINSIWNNFQDYRLKSNIQIHTLEDFAFFTDLRKDDRIKDYLITELKNQLEILGKLPIEKDAA